MTNTELSELVEYIKEQLAQGLSREGMQTVLVSAGWSPDQIAQAWRMILSGVTDNSPVQKLQEHMAALEERVKILESGRSANPWREAAATSPVKVEEHDTATNGRLFAVIGVVALLFGVSFLLKYAFDHDLVGQGARVIMGVCAGVLALVGGDILSRHRAYRQYSYFISGGGIGLTYLSLFFGFSAYHLFGRDVALIGMVLITGVAMFLALRSDGEPLLVISVAAGSLVPFLVYGGLVDYGAVSFFMLALLIAAISVGSIKRWSNPVLMAVFGTYFVQLVWIVRYWTDLSFVTIAPFLSLVFVAVLLWRIMTTIHPAPNKGGAATAAGLANIAGYSILMYAAMTTTYEAERGALLFALAVVQGLAGYVCSQFANTDREGVDAFMISSFILALIAVPVQFSGIVVTVLWLALASLLMVIGIAANMALVRRLSIPMFLLSVAKVFLYDSQSFSEINRIISFLVLGCILLLASFFWYRYKDTIKRFLS